MTDQPDFLETPAAPVPAVVAEPAAKPERKSSLPPEILAAIELRKAQNLVTAQLAALNWGKALDVEARRAVAEWGRRNNVDVTTEIDVLGNNIYLNARFFLRKLSDMIDAGLVDYAVDDYVHTDPRLAKIGTDAATREDERRAMERIKWGIPDAATGACVFRVKLKSMAEEVTGASWCGGGTRKNDPVGEAEPVKTSASRAARRAMRKLASHLPRVAKDMADLEASGKAIGITVYEEVKQQTAQAIESGKVGHRMLKPVNTDQGYAASDIGEPGT